MDRKEKLKEYRKKNKDILNEKSKQWNEENKEKRKFARAKWYQENKEKVIKEVQERYRVNKEKIKIARAKHYQENKEKILKEAKERYKEKKKRSRKTIVALRKEDLLEEYALLNDKIHNINNRIYFINIEIMNNIKGGSLLEEALRELNAKQNVLKGKMYRVKEKLFEEK